MDLFKTATITLMFSVLIHAGFPVKKTGQTVSYMTGDDGYYTHGQDRSYIDNADGTVTDTMLNLIWQNNYSDNKGYADNRMIPDLDQTKALEYCEDINLTGFTDWRLPTMRELASLVDYSVARPDPTIDPIFITTTRENGMYWTGTTYAPNTTKSWFVRFGANGVNRRPKPDTYSVRCVRNESPIKVNSTVTDDETDLIWQDDYSDNGGNVKMTSWNNAISYCNNLDVFGYDDWRLPHVNELVSITDISKGTEPKSGGGKVRAIDTSFDHSLFTELTNSPWFWSSTTNASSTKKAWGVCFLDGHISPHDKTEAKRYVRCVRDSTLPTETKTLVLTVDDGATATDEMLLTITIN